MNTPVRHTDHIGHGSADMLMECVAECLNLAALKADLAIRCADANDRAGLNYHARQGAAAYEQALGILKMLNERRASERSREGAA
ncbi:hypothetical protein [Methylobacterium sp. WSM2598]|uniref:hypothetical protein n=1 Tax=Methylobacterium sp. WSM2598 TaxID=398261 RepID=UPI000380161F|nr:hypothetical protein [Methylobacterium sp. WSM2598]